jgi:hypothetical protein
LSLGLTKLCGAWLSLAKKSKREKGNLVKSCPNQASTNFSLYLLNYEVCTLIIKKQTIMNIENKSVIEFETERYKDEV